MLHHTIYLLTFKNLKNHWKNINTFGNAFFFGIANCWHFSFYPFITTVRTRHLVMFFSFLAPRPPGNWETTHTGHTSTYHAAQTSQGIRDQALGKSVGSLSLRWWTLLKDLRCEKKKLIDVFFFRKNDHPQFTRRNCIAIYSNYVCVCVYIGIVVWKSLKLHHPSQIRCEFEGNDLSDGKKCAKKKVSPRWYHHISPR